MVYYQTNDVQRGAVVKTLGQNRHLWLVSHRHAGRGGPRVPGVSRVTARSSDGACREVQPEAG
jgi:hypothetical protein